MIPEVAERGRGDRGGAAILANPTNFMSENFTREQNPARFDFQVYLLTISGPGTQRKDSC
jgi:hypothetical protein